MSYNVISYFSPNRADDRNANLSSLFRVENLPYLVTQLLKAKLVLGYYPSQQGTLYENLENK